LEVLWAYTAKSCKYQTQKDSSSKRAAQTVYLCSDVMTKSPWFKTVLPEHRDRSIQHAFCWFKKTTLKHNPPKLTKNPQPNSWMHWQLTYVKTWC